MSRVVLFLTCLLLAACDGCSDPCLDCSPSESDAGESVAVCGDGVVDEGEACDDGELNGDLPGGCRLGCVLPSCGDGVLDPGEQCERPFSDVLADACRVSCRLAFCGDGVVDATEECDQERSDTEPDRCRLDCTLPRCGDGVKDASEQCDDGNEVSGDGCSSCQLPRCGDGILDPGELCFDAAETTPGWPGAAFATFARLDGDIAPELVLSAPDAGLIRVLNGLPGGGFEPGLTYQTLARPGPVVSGDVDGDGDVDVMVATADGLETWLNNGSGFLTRGEVVELDAALVSLVRAEALLFGAAADGTVRVLDGGIWSSVDAGGVLSGGVAVDLDVDGQMELVFAAPARDALMVLRRAGELWTAQLVALSSGARPVSVAAADLDRDGAPDLVVAESGLAGIAWLLNDGEGRLLEATRRVTGETSVGVLALDLNLDGHPDAAVVDEARGQVRALRGDGAGGFELLEPLSVGLLPGWLLSADTNHDQRPDLVVVNRGDGRVSRISSTR